MKYIITDQTIYWEQVYTRFLNLVDNHFSQYCNELILLQEFPDEAHFHHFYFSLPYFKCFQVISLFQASKVEDFNFKCNLIFYLIYIYSYRTIILLFYFSWWCVQSNLGYLIQNMILQVILIFHSTCELIF